MPPSLGKEKLTMRRRKLVKGLVEGKTCLAAAKDAGYTGADTTIRTAVSKELKNPNVANAIEKALNEAGATFEKSARVIAEAHDAREVKVFSSGHTGEISYSRPMVDHKTRLQAAELNGRFRKLLMHKQDDASVLHQHLSIGFFVVNGAQERGIQLD